MPQFHQSPHTAVSSSGLLAVDIPLAPILPVHVTFEVFLVANTYCCVLGGDVVNHGLSALCIVSRAWVLLY